MVQTELPISSLVSVGGEGGIRTLEHLLGCYSLSRRAPSTTRPPLRWERQCRTYAGPQGYRRRARRANLPRLRLAGRRSRLVGGCRLVARGDIQACIVGTRRRRREL